MNVKEVLQFIRDASVAFSEVRRVTGDSDPNAEETIGEVVQDARERGLDRC